jgi:hypothetical protein
LGKKPFVREDTALPESEERDTFPLNALLPLHTLFDEPVGRHVPETAKHPLVRLMPPVE